MIWQVPVPIPLATTVLKSNQMNEDRKNTPSATTSRGVSIQSRCDISLEGSSAGLRLDGT